ncbi:hypothetical protein C7N83_12800, partial [Neisseria iguanae]
KFSFGCKQHTRTDDKGYLEKRHISPADGHGCNHFELRFSDIAWEIKVYAEFRITESRSAKSFESNLCQPAKGCQPASCAYCCLKRGKCSLKTGNIENIGAFWQQKKLT